MTLDDEACRYINPSCVIAVLTDGSAIIRSRKATSLAGTSRPFF